LAVTRAIEANVERERDWPGLDDLRVVPMLLDAQTGNWEKVQELSTRLTGSGLDSEIKHWDSRDTDALAYEPSEEVAAVELCGRVGLCKFWACTQRWPDCAEILLPSFNFRDFAERRASADS
jgi:hypothetical protein